MTTLQKTLRWKEMIALFVGVPLLILRFPGLLGGPRLFGFLWIMGVICGVALFFDKKFDRKKLWNAKAVMPAMGWMVGRWILFAAVLTGLFGLFSGRLLPGLSMAVPTGYWRVFMFEPTEDYVEWADAQIVYADWLPDLLIGAYPFILPTMIFVFYPWVSVYPQNLIYRAFFCQRYRPILGGGWGLILINAGVFSLGHIMFNNWIVLLLTFVGGIIFTRTYLKSRSLLLATIEHAMYGLFCFYLGIGVFLLYGASG
ncbi:MAG: CPBP family intramembrane glutamic endopeptidase [Planctomycetota bacterium]